MFSSNASQVSNDANYIEDVFSTWLYTGNGSTQTITNGIDLAGKGGLVWIKNRQTSIGVPIGHILTDTARGVTKFLRSQSTSAQETSASSITAFNSSGFSFGSDTNINYSGDTYASWTFRKQPKFFDVVTYTGNGAASQLIPHNLQSTPGFLMVKSTSNSDDWGCWHRSGPAGEDSGGLSINSTSARQAGGLSSFFTSTTFDAAQVYDYQGATKNVNGRTYVAYLFAHDSGGFGLTGTDNVISCGSFTANGNNTITLGYEPQWVMVRRVSSAGNDWEIYDTMRGCSLTGSRVLVANTSGAEGVGGTIYPTATGFYISSYGSGDIIYIAIRRGPMRTPTTGTSVFSLDASSAGGSGGLLGAVTASDLVINSQRDPAANSPFVFIDRLRGVGQVNTGATTKALYSHNTNAETNVDTTSASSTAEGVNGAYLYSSAGKSSAIRTVQQGPGGSVAYNLIRAPSFFDEVCYTGTGVARTVAHNLAAVPELMIVKTRSAENAWAVYAQPLGNTGLAYLNWNFAAATGQTVWDSTTPTASTFSVNATATVVNQSGTTYVAYLFASAPGVSKVGSYTGTATTLQINCGFTAGARFVLIKRTDSTGDWYVWDSARGIVAGNDPYLLLNSTAAEVTSTDYIDTYSAGFEISSTAPAAINASGGTFIFLAIA